MTFRDTPRGRLYTPVDMSAAEATARRYRAEAGRDLAAAVARGLFTRRR